MSLKAKSNLFFSVILDIKKRFKEPTVFFLSNKAGGTLDKFEANRTQEFLPKWFKISFFSFNL